MYEQIYNLTSMFFKSLKGNLMYEFLISKFNGKRGPKRQLSLEQIVALNIYRFHFKTGDLKNYHKMIRELMRDKVPNLPNYENFMKATNKSTLNVIISSTEASLNPTGERWKTTFSLNIIRQEVLSVRSGTFSIALLLIWLTAIWTSIKTFSDYG